MKKVYSKYFWFLIILFFVIIDSGYSQAKDLKAKTNPHKELTFKALYINNFIKYVSWPEEAIKDTFRLGVLNDKLLTTILLKTTAKIKFGDSGLPIKVTFLEDIEDLSAIHMLYSDIEQNGFSSEDLFKAIENRPTLLITEGFEENTTMINFMSVANQQKFNINGENVASHGLIIHPSMNRYIIK